MVKGIYRAAKTQQKGLKSQETGAGEQDVEATGESLVAAIQEKGSGSHLSLLHHHPPCIRMCGERGKGHHSLFLRD